MRAFLTLVIVLFASLVRPAMALDAPTDPAEQNTTISTITAGVWLEPPFVIREGDGYSGMAIELWEAVVAERDLENTYVEFDTIRDLISAVEDGEVDIAVTALTVTEERAKNIDFTHPWFDGGLQIMISDAPRSGFGSVFAGLSESGHLRVYFWILVAVLTSTILLTLFDRKFDPDFHKRWRDGIADSFYTVMSVATTGKPPSRAKLFGWIGRIWSALWLICGVAIIAYVTSSITSVMTTIAISDRITGLSDLPGKSVSVLDGSTAEEFATTNGLRITSFPHMEEAVEALTEGRIDAHLGDAPVLDYFAHTRPQHDVIVVGELFAPEKYGFGIARDSALRRPLTISLIGADEDGLIEQLRTKYFGPRH